MRTLEYTYEVVELVAGERLVMRTAEGPFPMERMTLRNRGGPRGFARLFAPIMAAAVRHATRKDLARLKAVLEEA